MHILGTVDFYLFIPLSVTLTLAEGHKVSTKQNLLALFSRKLFKLNILRLLWGEIYWIKGNSCCFID